MLRRLTAFAPALLIGLASVLGTPAAHAQVVVNDIQFPPNIGRTLDATVTVPYTRTGAAAAVIQVAIPTQLGVAPPALPAGCTLVAGPAVDCTTTPGQLGTGGTITFDVRGLNVGGFSLTATSAGSPAATNTGTVRSSGELSVVKTKLPAGNLVPGQATTFTLQPQLAAGADDLPPGATLTLTDQLPGTSTDFTLTGIAPGLFSCNSVSAANGSRTVSCTITGPRTVAEINGTTVTLTGTPGNNGTFSNVGSVAADNSLYFDRDINNNLSTVNYVVVPGGDVQALGSFPALPVATGSAQTLTLTWRNNGPTALPAGGTVSTTIPAGFTLGSLPAGCTGPATGVVLGGPAAVSCSVGAAAVGGTQSFNLPLVMPAAAAAGSFTVAVAPPAGFGDGNAANDSINLPWQTVAPFADLRLTKGKSPSSGPVAPGSAITTTINVFNDAGSTSDANWSAAGGGTELRVVDYLRPTEIDGDTLTSVSAGWTCTVSNNADPADLTRSKRVLCVRDAAGSLAPGASLPLSFSTRVAPLVGQLTLSNRACTGETLLVQLVLLPGQGPQPPGSGQAANDCATAGGNLTATDVVSGQAAVAVRKESSNDGTAWVDEPGGAPLISAAATTQFWRITITTPAGGAQAPIPTLRLADTLPGILNLASPGAPAPSHVTPAITVNTAVTTGAATGSCPNLAAGASNLQCTFTAVQPGTTIVVTYSVQRPFAAGNLTNTAQLSSPDAVLSGTLSDAAAVTVEPRIDVAATTKVVTPPTPRIGQLLQFTITTQNLGPNEVATPGEFKIVDDLNTNPAGATVAFGDISAGGIDLSCSIANSALSDEAPLAAGHVRVRCTNTTPVAIYSTRSLVINARVLKPAAPLPVAGNVYTAQTNTARVDIPDSRCEFKTELSTNGLVSAACNDAASTSNNSRVATFDVLVPQIDLQQRKTRVLPAGQSSFAAGQPLRYRFRLQNNGPSRAEGVTMTDQLTVPVGFTLGAPVVSNINGVPAEGGYTLDTGKTGSVSCTQAAPNANLVCVLGPTAAQSFLDSGREVNFEVSFTQTGNVLAPVTFSNEALVCADETAGYETAGACNRVTPSNNNVASVNDVVFPASDLSLTKTTVTQSGVGVNQPVEYRLVVQNRGPSALQRIRLTDVLPPDFELITTGAQAPSVAPGSFVTAAPSTAAGAAIICAPTPAAITAAGQQQTVVCSIDAQPGPLGAGAFPGSGNPDNSLTVRLYARPKFGVFTGPYSVARTNNATVAAGLAANGTPLAVDPNPTDNSSSSDVFVARVSLAGRVFLDRNGNGLQDGVGPAEDEGIGGVTVTLSGVDLWGNPVTLARTSQAAAGATRGDYLFDHLPPGQYTVTETQPVGYGNSPGTPVASRGGTYAPSPAAGSSAWQSVLLEAGMAGVNYNFPESQFTGISGRVFSDRGDNAVLDPTDPGMAGVTIGLYGPGTVCPAAGALPPGALQTVSTDASGGYAFSGLLVGGSYVVCQQQPTQTADRPPLLGSAAATPRPNQIDVTGLPLGGSIDNHFPEVHGAISGLVFLDYNPATPGSLNNGAPDPGEPGIGSALPGAGVPIQLTGVRADGLPFLPQVVTTAADGSWRFDELAPGTYRVTQSAIPLVLGLFAEGQNTAGPVVGGTSGVAGGVGTTTISDLVLGVAGGRSSDNRFAKLPRSSVSGVVFVDENRDAAFNLLDTQRVSGVEIELRQGGSNCSSGTLLGTTRTGTDGAWAFPGGTVTPAQVGAGQTLRVCERQPAGYVDAVTVPGVNGTSVRENEILVSNLPVAGSTGNHFGEWLAPPVDDPVISGTVFVDRNRDDRFTDDDPGRLEGVEVRLVSGASCSGGPVVGTTRTNLNGVYRFPGGTVAQGQLVAGGTYSICQGQPGGYLQGMTLPGPGNASPGPDHILITALPLGGSGGNDFGERAGRITGQVFLDDDDNGRPGAGETGIAGVTFTLTGPNPGDTRTAVSGPDGRFAFEDLPGGTWTVTEQATQPSVAVGNTVVTTVNGRTTAGTGGGTATPVATVPSAIGGIVLPVGGAAVDNFFGERLPPGGGTAGPSPDLQVSKVARTARFVGGRPGAFAITVRNAGGGTTSGPYTVADRLPAGMTLAAAPSGSGWSCTGGAGAASFSCTRSDVLAPATEAPVIEVPVQLASNAATPLHNAALVEGGGEAADRAPTADERERFASRPDTLPACTVPATHNACRATVEVQQPASLSGSVWLETGTVPRQRDAGDRPLPGWVVELVDPATGRVISTVGTGEDGRYRFADLEPGVPYGVRFRDPASGIVYAGPVNGDTGNPAAPCNPQAQPSSCGAGRNQGMLTVVLAPGQELTQQSLPVDPSGVVYDSQGRQPVPGAGVSFAPAGSCPGWDPAQHVVGATLGGYTLSGGSIRMTTGSNGFYNVVLTPTAPASCTFAITVEPPPGLAFPSQQIPPQPGALVPAGPVGTVVAVQPQPTPPTGSNTPYYLQLTVGSATPDVVHNHIPLDPGQPGAVQLRKTGDRAVAEIGDTVRYRITVSVGPGASPRQVTVVDRLPAGFTYVAGTAFVGGRRIADPSGAPGPQLRFQLGGVAAGTSATLEYRLRVGVGAQQGDGINQAVAYACQTVGGAGGCVSSAGQPLADSRASNDDRFRVRVAGGVFGIEACMLGKVYVDCNGNHVQDREELGIPGVRLVMQDGTTLVSDSEGKVSACGLPPRSAVLRIDERTLPRGSRLVTSSNRNLGDAGSLWLDLKMGELHRADFIEGSCSNTVLDQVKARRALGEVTAPHTEKAGRPALRFDSKAHGRDALTAPAQGTDSANQRVPKERPAGGREAAGDERALPTDQLPMNRPPPRGRSSGDAPDAPATTPEARDGTR